MDFRKFFKRFLIVSLAVVILGAIVVGMGFRTQISEGIAYAQKLDQEQDRFEWDMYSSWRGREGEFQYGIPYPSDENWTERIPFTQPSMGAKIMAVIYGCLCVLIIAVYWLAVTAWLYKAAAVSAMNRVLWTFAGLIGNLLSVILFLALRSIIREECPVCGHWQKKGGRYCVKCGSQLWEKCPSCGSDCNRDNKYCPSCGYRLHEKSV